MTLPNPTDFPTSSARHCLARWLTAWAGSDWAAMAALSQLTWASVQADPAAWLRDWYSGKALAEATIERTTPFGDASEDITAVVTYRLLAGKRPVKVRHRITVRVIRETALYEPAPRIGIAGRWGVNPISALREEATR